MIERVTHERAVFILKRHDVGDCSQRGKTNGAEQIFAHCGRRSDSVGAHFYAKLPRELERDERPADFWKRVGRDAVEFQLGMHDRRRFRKALTFRIVVYERSMMVRYDHVESDRFGVRDFCEAGDSAVDRYDNCGVLVLFEKPERFAVEPVTFFKSVGNVVDTVSAADAYSLKEHGGCGHAVDVIVAVDDDLFLRADRIGQKHGGFFTSRESRGIVKTARKTWRRQKRNELVWLG